MDPPPPPSPPPSAADAAASDAANHHTSEKTPEITPPSSMLPPPPPQNPESKNLNNNSNTATPYQIPPWSEPPSQPFFFEILKDGTIVDQLDLTKKGAYMFGRIDLCDFVLEHPTISRFHAVIQFKGTADAYVYDLGSTHGTFINKKQVKAKVYVDLHVGDVIRFGHSSRLYIFQGPEDLMLLEAEPESTSYAKEREASLRRAREGAALADGISWGMGEDAVEEAEDDPDELTWQTYKGELTEKQQKTREKVLKRMEKIAHMKKEMSAIRAKDISQGGLTQGQQTQIARNEQRISQIFEELESLEETLNDSIRESLGARGKKSSRSKQKGLIEDEDELLSDDDEFYDRTKKKPASKSADTQSVETADSLLDKKEALVKEMDEKRRVLSEEKNKIPEPTAEEKAGDALDAFMSGLSSQLVVDKAVQLEKEISSLQTKLDRIVYLLKIADPTGETAKKRAINEQSCKVYASDISGVKILDKSKTEKTNANRPEDSVGSSGPKQVASDVIKEAGIEPKSTKDVTDVIASKPTTYTVAKPQWLGAVLESKEPKNSQQTKQADANEEDEFVDYKDRQKILESSNSHAETELESELESAAPGLILRKKKPVEMVDSTGNPEAKPADTMAEDAVALLLKHKRGLYATDEEGDPDNNERDEKQSGQESKRRKRVIGPEKPAFLKAKSDDVTWVPPKGQSGDGRTSLNDRFGY